MLDSHRRHILQGSVSAGIVERFFMLILRMLHTTSGRLMSLLSSLKFCVIEHA